MDALSLYAASLGGSAPEDKPAGPAAAPATGGDALSLYEQSLTVSAPAQGVSAPGNVKAFVEQYKPLADRISRSLGVAPEALLGQWGLETGWGKSVIPGTNNLGNIKDFSGNGAKAKDNMTGSVDAYRAYGTADEFGDDFAGLLSRRYKSAIGAGADSKRYFQALKTSGYAEDPDYVNKGVAATKMAAGALGVASAAGQSGEFFVGAAAQPPLTRTTLEAAKDVALGAGAGVVQGVEMVASAFGADNAVARGANDAAQGLVDMQSPARKQQREQRAAAIQEAETSGSTWAEIVANVGAFTDAPVESALNAIGTSVPTLMTALIPGLGQANVARLVVQGAMGAAQGAGAVKGSIYEAVERELTKPGPGALSKDDAKKAAAAAQAYDSQNGGDIALGALLGWAAGSTGMEKSFARLLSKEGADAAASGIAKRTAMGVIGEAPMEGLQGGQERLAANRALQNEGVDVPTWQGVAGSAAGEAVASVVPGGVFGAMTPSRPALPPELQPVAEKAAEPNSPLSKAAMAANTPEVFAQREAQRQAVEPAATPANANTAARLAELESIGEGRPAQAAKDDQGRDVEIPAEPGRFFTAEEKAEYDDLTARRDATPGAKPKEADTIGDRAKEIAAAVRDSGALETLRSPDSPVKASDLVKDLATAQSPNTPAAAREQALGRVEFALQWAGIDLAARPAPAPAATAPQADPVMSAMSDPKVSATDKTALRDAYNAALNVRLPQATRDQALAQAREIAGRYAAPPAAPAAPAAAQTPAVLGPIDGAPGTLLAQAERMEEGAFELEAEDFPDEARQLRDQADSLRERAATVRAGEAGVDLEAEAGGDISAAANEQNVVEAVAGSAESQIAAEPVQLPVARATPAGDGPAYQRRRRASLQQLAANGFTTVTRQDGSFSMVNQKTGQTFALDGAADAQMARKAVADYIAAAAAETNTDPTDGQKSAGNYKKARVDFEGLNIAIENPVGSERKGKDDNGEAWATPMELAHYGYVVGSESADGDGSDIYLLKTPRLGGQAYVIDQYNEDGSFDETKTVLGASSEAEALRVYDAGFSDGSGPDRRGAVTAMSVADFKAWANTPAAKKAAGPAPEPAPGAVVDGSMKVKLSKDESVNVDLVKELPEVESVARGGRATRISKKQGAVIEAIARAFGKDVQFYTGANSTRVGDGFILPSDQSKIYLNATSSRSPLVVFGHELLHQLKRDNPEAHAAIVAVVARHMNRDATKAVYGKLGYSDDQIMEELVSDLGGDLMADPTFWADVMAEVREANGDSAAKKILAQLAEFLYRAIDAMTKNLRSYADTGAGSKLVDDMAEIRAAFQTALAGYMQTHGIAKPAMQAEILRAGQEAKRSAVRNQTPEDQRKALAEKLRGTDGWLKAPNGKKTNLDERQWVVVRTPAFKAWFGDWESDPANASKAVDENGEPKVFYHGSTEAGFTEFDTDGKGKTKGTGAFFTDDFRMAVGYSGTKDDAPVYPAERIFADPDLIDGLSIEAGILAEVVTSSRGDKSWEWYESEEAALEDLELEPGEKLTQKPGYRMTDPDGYETVGTKEEIIDAISDIKVSAPGVYDAFLNVRDLVEIDWQGKNWDEGPTEQVWNILDEEGFTYDVAYSQEDADAYLAKNPGFTVEQDLQAQYESTDDAARSVRDMDADGVLIKDVFDTGPKGYAEDGNVLVVYDPKNIKSASANTGAFDLADANITRSATRDDALTVEGYHFSQQPRKMLSSLMYGTGLQGSDRDAIMRHPDERLRQRISFYVNKGTGVRAESGVGGYVHRATLENIYDSNADVKRLKQGRDKRAFESAVLDAGYDGYLDRMEGAQPGQVILLGRRAIQPELLGQRTKIDNAKPVPAPAARDMDLGDRIAANKALPSGKLTPQRWAEVLGKAMPAEAAELEAAGLFDGDTAMYKDQLVARARTAMAPAIASRLRDDPMEVSSRAPWGKTAAEDPIADLLVVGLDSSRAGEKAFEKNVALVREYPNYRPTKSASTTERQAERFIEMSKDNLLWLYDSVPAEIRERSHLWYDGANKIAKTWAPKYGLQPSQIAGVMAVLSPQKDWFMNVDLARRVIDTMDGHGDTRWNAEMTATAQRIFGKPQYADDVAAITGKTLDEVNDLVLKAMWVRTYDEAYNDRTHALLSPEGDVMGKVMTQKDAPAKVAWGDLGSISKAVAIIQDGTLANISARLGGEHKVRNFYNNILVPNGANGHVTIDTHAVAAALLRPLSGSSIEILHNFGGGGAASSAIHGSSGTYGLYAEAYRRAAAERGVLAREMQSITWEAVRGLFTPGFKSQQKNVDTTDGIWENYRKGRLSLENARQQILEAAGGIEQPSWFRPGTGSPAQEGRGDAGVVPGVQLPGRRAESTAGGAGGPAAEAAAVQRSAGRDGGGQQLAADQALPGSPRVEGATGPDPRLVAVAEAYAQKVGIDFSRQAEYVQVDEKRAARIAAAYEAMEHAPQDRKVKAAYADLIKQTRAQYDALVEAGYSAYFADQTNDPYAGNPWNAMRDLRANQRMAVFPTAAGFGSNETFDPAENPLLADTGLVWGYGSPDGQPMKVLVNDLFRYVHDAFGHGLEGAGFRAQGEENAWQAHIRMFTGAAKGAITSETRGQNSWLNFNEKSGEANRTAKVEDTVFADQKTGLMPEWTWTEGVAGDMPAARSAARDLPKATLADFEPRGISRLLGVDNWAILTAENPMGEQAGDKTNAAAMRRLRQRLAEMDGVEYRAIRGKYGDNEENSLAVVGITEEQAKELGREFNQDSVLTRKGFIYQDGSINPATGIEVFRNPPENYYSRIGDTIFRIDIDFDKKIDPAADAKQQQRIDALKELIACLGK